MPTPEQVIVFSPLVSAIYAAARDLKWETVSRVRLMFQAADGTVLHGCMDTAGLRGRPRGMGYWCAGGCSDEDESAALDMARAHGFVLWTPGVTL